LTTALKFAIPVRFSIHATPLREVTTSVCVVTAPVDAVLTSRAYFASTPLVV
jgi:hypothetical protein